MCKFGKVLVSCLLVLLPLLGAGAFPHVYAEETLPTVTRTRFSTGATSIENLDVEYTVTGGLVESIHIDTPSFTVTDGSSNGYHINSGNIKLKTENGLIKNYANVSIIPNSGNIWTVQANGIDVNGNDISYTAQVENLHVSYELVQHIFIGFNVPVYGSCSCAYSIVNGRSLNAMIFPIQNNAAYYTFDSSTRTGVMTFRSYGESTISVDLVEYHFDESSFPSKSYSPIVNFDRDTWSYGDLVAYEEPVKDVTSHNLLTSILEALDGTNGQQSSVDNANQNVNDSVSGLSTQGNQMHNVENNIMNSMDTALLSDALQTDVVSEIRGNGTLNSSMSWVSNQVTRLITGFNDITPMWEFMFIMPLVIGIGLVIIGRLR